MPEGFPVKEALFVLLMVKAVLYYTLLHTISLPDALPTGLEDGIQLNMKPHLLGDGAAGAFVLHLAEHLLVFITVEWVVFQVVARVLELCVCGPVCVYIFCLDLEEERVSV